MAAIERVTVTLPSEILKDIDRREKNRSKFILEAVRHELERRQHEELLVSLRNPHSESVELAAQGIADWGRGLPEEDTETLVDRSAGRAIQWIPGEGWVEGGE